MCVVETASLPRHCHYQTDGARCALRKKWECRLQKQQAVSPSARISGVRWAVNCRYRPRIILPFSPLHGEIGNSYLNRKRPLAFWFSRPPPQQIILYNKVYRTRTVSITTVWFNVTTQCFRNLPLYNLCLLWFLAENSESRGARRSGDRIPVKARFSTSVHTGPGAHPASYKMGTGSLSWG